MTTKAFPNTLKSVQFLEATQGLRDATLLSDADLEGLHEMYSRLARLTERDTCQCVEQDAWSEGLKLAGRYRAMVDMITAMLVYRSNI
jgi:hypothetical protein